MAVPWLRLRVMGDTVLLKSPGFLEFDAEGCLSRLWATLCPPHKVAKSQIDAD
jgi:hypothetical protein